ncbi:acetylglutamate kinase [Fusobacterium sp. IOR10]|uniref:acetylglutamate kinase n=1 Tax=Fusobacterium sp. IOR10 TaxID=2665157 RepID=UPI0013D4AA36|nr:acetylglutamate kinase [Fusobacterium sp. IOR10]
MENKYTKINNIIEIIPYIDSLIGKIIVIKYGGNALINETKKIQFIKDIVFLKKLGAYPVIIHGGGPDINAMLGKINKESKFLKGNRITDNETMEIVEMILSGKVNKNLVSLINKYGGNSVGISGKDSNLIIAEKKYIINDNEKIDIGNVGEILKINGKIIYTLIKEDYIPVISSVGTDYNGNTYNINADYAASSIASELKAHKFIFITNAPGIMMEMNNINTKIETLNYDEAITLIKDKIITEGMIPKVEACLSSLKNGVDNVHIIDGNLEHSLLVELLTDLNTGTKLIKN